MLTMNEVCFTENLYMHVCILKIRSCFTYDFKNNAKCVCFYVAKITNVVNFTETLLKLLTHLTTFLKKCCQLCKAFW